MPSKDQGDPAAKCLRKAWWFSMVACARSFRGQGPPPPTIWDAKSLQECYHDVRWLTPK